MVLLLLINYIADFNGIIRYMYMYEIIDIAT